MKGNSRRATLTDVAREAGVSLKTASRVINGVPSVADDLREQVLGAAQRLSYRPHRGAATMRTGTSDMVGMVIRDMTNIFYSRLAAGAADEAGRHGCLVITCSSEGLPEREEKLLEAVFAQRPRGMIITPTAQASPLMVAEAALGTPVVAVDEPLQGLEVDTVTFDNFSACREAVAAAVDLGRQDFAILSDSTRIGTMEPRVMGAHAALADRGLRVAPERTATEVHTVEQAREATARLLSTPHPPDAIFCANNVSALGAAPEVHARGLDVAIVAFDDFPLSQTLPHPVVVVEHDDRAMGREAARLLFERIAQPERPLQHVRIPTHLYTY